MVDSAYITQYKREKLQMPLKTLNLNNEVGYRLLVYMLFGTFLNAAFGDWLGTWHSFNIVLHRHHVKN
jgi:hypothetical protein